MTREMADWKICFNWMLENEDMARAYAVVPDAPPGAHAVSGINSAAFPAQFAAIAALSQDQRGPAVEQFYRQEFWSKWFDALTSDELAKRVFDAAVNMGAGTAWRILQGALGIHVDGLPGPLTVNEANSYADAVQDFIAGRKAHYEAIIDAHPEDARYEDAWLDRAGK
jgi:lysozyme family protein